MKLLSAAPRFRHLGFGVFTLASTLLFAACADAADGGDAAVPADGPSALHDNPSAGPLPEGAQLPPDHPPIGIPGDAADLGADATVATVLETMDSGGYTYARLEIGGDEVWAAGPPTSLAEGDRVALGGVMGMENFSAPSLGRTFDRILFVSTFAPR